MLNRTGWRFSQAEYGSYPGVIDPHYRKNVLKPLNDRFCLAEACLIADVVENIQSSTGDKTFHPRYVCTHRQHNGAAYCISFVITKIG